MEETVIDSEGAMGDPYDYCWYESCFAIPLKIFGVHSIIGCFFNSIPMEIKQIFDLVIAIAGLSILLWLFFYAIKDLLTKDNAKRKLMHNTIILLLSLVYIIKIIVKDLMPVLN